MKRTITVPLPISVLILTFCACGHKREEKKGDGYTILTSEKVEKNSEEEFEQEVEKVTDDKETKNERGEGVQKNNGTIQTEDGLNPREQTDGES